MPIAVFGEDFNAALAQMAVLALHDPQSTIAQLLRTLASVLPVVVYSSDREGTFTACFGGGLRAVGIEDDELVGEHVSIYGQPAVDTLHQVLAEGPKTFEVEGVTNDVAWVVRTLVAPLPDGSGVAAVSFDVTGDLLHTRTVSRNEEMFAAAVEAIDEGVLIQDDHGRVVRANSSVFQILRLPERDFAPLLDPDSGWHAIHSDGSPFPTSDFPGRQCLRLGQPLTGITMGIVSPTDDTTWLLVNAFPVSVGGERLVVSTFTDITDQRMMTDALRENEQRFRMLSASAPIGIFITDESERIAYANPELLRQTGLEEDEIKSRSWPEIIHPDDIATVAADLKKFLKDDAPYRLEHRLVRPDGSVCWVRARLARMTNRNGESVGLVGTAADITDLIASDMRLRESEERTRAIIETAAEGIISTDEVGRIIEFNAAAERILGYDSDEAVGQMHFTDLFDAELADRLQGLLAQYLEGAPPQVIGQAPTEYTMRKKNGDPAPVELAITEVVTREGRLFTGVIHDISERKAFEEQLEHQATHDALTGLPNRAMLVAELDAALNRAARHRRGIGVLFVELERLQHVTDSLGHRAGDQLIGEAAHRLARLVAEGNRVGEVTRFGGDQFVVFLEDVDDVGDAVALATDVIDVLDRPYVVSSEEAFIKTAVGISFAANGIGTAESLISNADVAMKRARSDATSGFEVFDTEMRQWVDTRRKLEIAMRHGIERGEFELYYQPIVKVRSRCISGFEALVRWNHPELGLLPPAEFIPLAEDTGLIIPLGEHILRTACRQLATWQKAFPERGLTVSVNLSGRQLALPDLPATVAGAILEAGVSPSGLDFEITETVLLDDVDATTRTLDGLKKIGVNLSIDDFGTGYSSLTYLCRFPIDVVKVDRSFVSQIGTRSRDESIVSVVVGLAQTLNMDVVAEGVETKEQLAALEELECSYAQGYLFSRPRPVAEADRLLVDGGLTG